MARMTDAEYLFKQDIREKKTTGYGAKHKKAGVKGPKGCRMPSDNLTKKEKEALNGEVVSWSPRAYYSWEELKAFPRNIQKEYLKAMCEKYSCGISSVMSGLYGTQVAGNCGTFLATRGWSREEFGKALSHGAESKNVIKQIRQDVELAHAQVEKFKKKWEVAAEPDISEEVTPADTKEETPEWQRILEEEKRKSAEAAFDRAKEAESEPFYEAVTEFLTEEDSIPLHAATFPNEDATVATL